MVRAAYSTLRETTSTGTTTSLSTCTTEQAAVRATRGAPVFLVAKIAAVADDQGGIPAEFQGDFVGGAVPDHQTDFLPGQGVAGFPKAFQHEGVVAPVGFGVGIGQPESHHHRQLQAIGLLNRIFQGVVVKGPLGLLHPVEDIASPDHPPVVESLNTGR